MSCEHAVLRTPEVAGMRFALNEAAAVAAVGAVAPPSAL